MDLDGYFEAQLPVDREELKDLVAVGAKVCLVSPELHPDHEAKFPTDAFMKSVDTVGIENFHAVCTKRRHSGATSENEFRACISG